MLAFSEEDPEFRRLRDEWLELSSDTFLAMKSHFALEDVWAFSLASPDADPDEMRDPRGSAAFALRRVQALRYLLTFNTDRNAAEPSPPPHLVVGFGSDLLDYFNVALTGDTFGNSPSDVLVQQTMSRCEFVTRRLVTLAASAALEEN